MNDFEFTKFAFEHNYYINIEFIDDSYLIKCYPYSCVNCPMQKECELSIETDEKITQEQYNILKSEFPEHFI